MPPFYGLLRKVSAQANCYLVMFSQQWEESWQQSLQQPFHFSEQTYPFIISVLQSLIILTSIPSANIPDPNSLLWSYYICSHCRAHRFWDLSKHGIKNPKRWLSLWPCCQNATKYIEPKKILHQNLGQTQFLYFNPQWSFFLMSNWQSSTMAF